jgi:UPF0716 protein FxsA
MRFSHILILLFTVIPIIELYLLITVGKLIGVWPTILIVILTAVIGVQLLHFQGLATLQKVQNALAQGQVPAEALIEGLLLLVGGALLLTPGFFTDVLGLTCLLPYPRIYLARWLNRYIQAASYTRKTDKRNMTVEGECRREQDNHYDKKIE